MAIRKELTFETGNTINWPEGRFTANSGVFAAGDTVNGVPAGAPTPHVARLTAGPDPLRGPGSARSQLSMKNSDPPYGWNPAKPWVWTGIDGLNGAERWLRGSFYVQTGKFTPLYDAAKGDSQLTYGWHSVDGVNLYIRVTPDRAHWEVLVRGGNLLPTPKDPATGKYIPPLIATGYDAGINLLGIGPWFVSIQHSKVYQLAPIVFDKWIEVVIHNLYKPDLTGFTEIHFVVDGVVTNVLPQTPAALIYNNINFSAPYPNGPGLGTERDGIKSTYHEQENYQPGIPALDPPSEMWFGGSAIYDNELDVWTSSAHTALRSWPWPGIGTLPPSVDVMAPTVNFTNPAANGAVLTGVVQLTASAVDNIGIDHVDFKVDGVTFATDTYPPFVKNLDTTALNTGGTRKYPDGAHTLTAAAYDAAGNSNTSTRTVTIDNTLPPPTPPPDPPSDTPPTPPSDTTPPTCTLTAPANGSTATGVITVSATATDNVAVQQVDFLADGVVFATDTASPFSTTWDSAGVPNGSHTIGARATDTSGNMSTVSQVTVTASNTTAPPPDPTPPPAPTPPPDPVPGTRLPYWGTIGGVGSAPTPDVPPPPPPSAITKVQDIGAASAGSQVLSRTITVAAGVTVGDRVTVAGTLSADATVTVTDSGNNVYTTRPYALHSSGTTKLFLADAQVVTALGAGATIKITASASASFAVAAHEWSGIDPTNPFVSLTFVESTIVAGDPVTLTAPAAAVPDKGLALVLFAGTNQNAIVTPSAGFTDLAGASSSGTLGRFIDGEWKVVSPAATVTPGTATFKTVTAGTQAIAATAVYAI